MGNMGGLTVLMVFLGIMSLVHGQGLLLQGYSGSQPIFLNENGTIVEDGVIKHCTGLTRRGPGKGRTLADFPLNSVENDCILKCQYVAHGVFPEFGFLPRKLKAVAVHYYFQDFTNATEPIIKVIVRRFRRCKLAADFKEHELRMAETLPGECYYFALFNKCLYMSGSG